ncbi:MAG: hypothetical protein ChlgKO_08950 [Chlamydiales bacterium]
MHLISKFTGNQDWKRAHNTAGITDPTAQRAVQNASGIFGSTRKKEAAFLTLLKNRNVTDAQLLTLVEQAKIQIPDVENIYFTIVEADRTGILMDMPFNESNLNEALNHAEQFGHEIANPNRLLFHALHHGSKMDTFIKIIGLSVDLKQRKIPTEGERFCERFSKHTIDKSIFWNTTAIQLMALIYLLDQSDENKSKLSLMIDKNIDIPSVNQQIEGVLSYLEKHSPEHVEFMKSLISERK